MRIVKVVLLLVALNLIPLIALANTPPPAKKPAPTHSAPATAATPAPNTELNYSDFQSALWGSPQVQFNNGAVVLHGIIDQKCITPNLKITSFQQGNDYGFMMDDPNGDARKCMQAEANLNCDSEGVSCVDVSQIPGYHPIQVSSGVHVDVAWAYKDLKQYGDTPQIQTVVANAQLSTDEITQNEINVAQCNYRRDRQANDFADAQTDAQRLYDLGAISQDDLTKILATLDSLDVNDLLKKAGTASIDSLSDLENQASQLAQAHSDDPKFMDRIVQVYEKISQRYTSQKNVKSDDFDSAASVLSDANDLTGVSDATAARLANDQTQLDIGRGELSCKSGMTPDCVSQYQNLQSELSQDRKDACSGSDAQSQACYAATQTYCQEIVGSNPYAMYYGCQQSNSPNILQMGQMAQQQAAQQQQLLQQSLQQMAQPGGSAGLNGFPMATSANPALAGGVPGFTPLGTGGMNSMSGVPTLYQNNGRAFGT